MIIHLNTDWRISSDPHQWILEHRVTANKARGEHRWRNIGYFHTLLQAVQEAAQRAIRLMTGSFGPDALEPLLARCDTLLAEITAALAGIDSVELRRAS